MLCLMLGMLKFYKLGHYCKKKNDWKQLCAEYEVACVFKQISFHDLCLTFCCIVRKTLDVQIGIVDMDWWSSNLIASEQYTEASSS